MTALFMRLNTSKNLNSSSSLYLVFNNLDACIEKSEENK